MGNQQSQTTEPPKQPQSPQLKKFCHHSPKKIKRIQRALSFLSSEASSPPLKQDDPESPRDQQRLRDKYCLPHNEQEQDRLTQLHFLSKHCFGGNCVAPVRSILQQPRSSKGQPHVLDIACGAGTWILEMACEFPNAQFYGIDCAAMFPSDIKPANVYFAQGDVRTGLHFQDNFFDFIHMSYVYNCFSRVEREALLKEIKRVLKPGGFVEFRDAENIIKNAGPITGEYQQKFKKVMEERQDIDITWASQMAEQLQSVVGLTDIHQKVVSINFLSSSKLSSTFMMVVRGEIQGYFDYFTPLIADVPVDRMNEHIDRILEECRRHRSFLNHVLVWGRKRLIDDTSHPVDGLSSTADGSYEITAEPTPIVSAIPNLRLNSLTRTDDIYQFSHGFTE
ncbi:hypothetical protein BX666DRAFT_1584109 [Dichotomocladium elegans]|nr:hypothetical protein BX666DRAFT_1584109 [Dichotomocladium elegans]